MAEIQMDQKTLQGKNKEDGGLEMEEVQWDREAQSGVTDIPREHKISFLLKPLENTFPNPSL